MSLTSWLGFRTSTNLPDSETSLFPLIQAAQELVRDQAPSQLWGSQPHLRTVVDFLARNIAQLGVHQYHRAADGGRERVYDSELAKLVRKPNPDETGYEFWRSVVGDLALYDIAYALVLTTPRQDIEADHEIRTIRPSWVVGTEGATAYNVEYYLVRFPEQAETVRVPAKQMVVWHGWNPLDSRTGMSPVLTLKNILAEQAEASLFRSQLWQRGGKVGAYLSRPATAPKWSPDARTTFIDNFREQWTGKGAKAGGVPLFEDGLELKRVGFSAKDEQYVEANKLSLQTVASVYHVNPTMVGLLDNANYANVREFRRMLYGETLGPIIVSLEERVNEFLLPLLGVDNTTEYLEFNVEQRLKGSFEEQAAVFQSAVGGPWMTINEARSKQNMPSVEGGDELIRPKNLYANGEQGDEVEEEPTGEPPAITQTPAADQPEEDEDN